MNNLIEMCRQCKHSKFGLLIGMEAFDACLIGVPKVDLSKSGQIYVGLRYKTIQLKKMKYTVGIEFNSEYRKYILICYINMHKKTPVDCPYKLERDILNG